MGKRCFNVRFDGGKAASEPCRGPLLYKRSACLAVALAVLPGWGYVPEPQPVRGDVEITAVYYPGTDQMSEWDVIAQTCPERKPLLGWYDEGDSVTIDGEWHEYEVPLAGHPDWNGSIDELWFEACELIHSRVAIDWMRFE